MTPSASPADAFLLEKIRLRQKDTKEDPCEATIAVLREAGVTGDELVRMQRDLMRKFHRDGNTIKRR